MLESSVGSHIICMWSKHRDERMISTLDFSSSTPRSNTHFGSESDVDAIDTDSVFFSVFFQYKLTNNCSKCTEYLLCWRGGGTFCTIQVEQYISIFTTEMVVNLQLYKNRTFTKAKRILLVHSNSKLNNSKSVFRNNNRLKQQTPKLLERFFHYNIFCKDLYMDR